MLTPGNTENRQTTDKRRDNARSTKDPEKFAVAHSHRNGSPALSAQQ